MVVHTLPNSGPMRFDILDGRWRYSHSGDALHDLLTRELSKALDTEIDFNNLGHSYLVFDGKNWT